MDPVTIAALVTAVAAALKAFKPSRPRSKIDHKSTEQIVDADVLGQFLGITDRMADLELQVAGLKLELDDLQSTERFLRGALEGKDKELAAVKMAAAEKQVEILNLQARVKHLEAACERAGLNDYEVEE
jgi:alkylhydroperoxidase/carboxymuconolactone decarboxylase family protein YurZ